MKILNLKLLLDKISEGSNSTKELNSLIHYSIKIASVYLRTKFLSKLNNFSTAQIEELAMDSVVQLFIRNTKGELALVESAKNWKMQLNNHSDVDYFIHKVVWKAATQTVYNVFKEQDPFFDKINKTISTCIISNGYHKVLFAGTVYIVEKKVNLNTEKLISNEDFELIPAEFFVEKQKKLLTGLWKYISDILNNYPAIPFNSLIKRIKNLSCEYYDGFFETKDESINGQLSVDEILKQTKSNISSILKSTYLNKSKIDNLEYNSIYNAFVHILNDLRNGGMNSSLFQYLQFEMKDLSKEEFYARYHKIMNYILGDVKSCIKNMLINF